MKPKKITPTWLRKLRERLEEEIKIHYKPTGMKWKDDGSVRNFLIPILKKGEEEEIYMTVQTHKELYGGCDCEVCKK